MRRVAVALVASLGALALPTTGLAHAAPTVCDRFAAVATRERVALSKPDPALYRVALEDLGVEAAAALAVEDSPNGVAAAKGAGLFCVAVANPMTAASSLAGADLRLSSLRDRRLSDLL